MEAESWNIFKVRKDRFPFVSRIMGKRQDNSTEVMIVAQWGRFREPIGLFLLPFHMLYVLTCKRNKEGK